MQDLGHFDAPVIVFGGPYSNLQATRAMRDESDRLGIPPERLTVEEEATPGEVVETILEVCGQRALIVGMANIKGGGGHVARYFGNRAIQTEIL